MRGEPTPALDSGNNTALEEYVEIAFVLANSFILSSTSVVGAAANVFVILAVYRQKSLQTSNNALVVNLAVIDFLRCVIDCPVLLTIVVSVYRNRQVDNFICDIQMASFSFSCCIQLLTLACISAERYQAIAQPFKASQRKRRIKALIPLTWTFAILVSAFCVIFLRDSPLHVKCQRQQRETLFSYDKFGLYMLFPLWAACFGVIIGFYARIFALVRSHSRKIFDKGTFPLAKKDKKEEKPEKEKAAVVENECGRFEQNPTLSLGNAQTQAESNSPKERSAQSVSINSEDKKEFKDTVKMSNAETKQARPLSVQATVLEKKPLKTEQSNPHVMKVEVNLSNGDAVSNVKSLNTKQASVSFNTQEQSKDRLKSEEESKENSFLQPPSLPAPNENSQSTTILLTEPDQALNNNEGETLTVASQAQVTASPPVSSNVPETEAMQLPAAVEGAVCMMPSKASKERANKKKEGKMAKRAGYIILTFLLFWLPLITTILVNYFIHKNTNSQIIIIEDMEVLSVSVACITSLSDPIIYAAVNPQFSSEFYRLKNRMKSIFHKKR
ncbi:unnamed protein product [Oreochromis niloticus]|nr:unnamed protein product [Mustela putorius furo]